MSTSFCEELLKLYLPLSITISCYDNLISIVNEPLLLIYDIFGQLTELMPSDMEFFTSCSKHRQAACMDLLLVEVYLHSTIFLIEMSMFLHISKSLQHILQINLFVLLTQVVLNSSSVKLTNSFQRAALQLDFEQLIDDIALNFDLRKNLSKMRRTWLFCTA